MSGKVFCTLANLNFNCWKNTVFKIYIKDRSVGFELWTKWDLNFENLNPLEVIARWYFLVQSGHVPSRTKK